VGRLADSIRIELRAGDLVLAYTELDISRFISGESLTIGQLEGRMMLRIEGDQGRRRSGSRDREMSLLTTRVTHTPSDFHRYMDQLDELELPYSFVLTSDSEANTMIVELWLDGSDHNGTDTRATARASPPS